MSPLAESIVKQLRAGPQQFSEIVDLNRNIPWPEFLIHPHVSQLFLYLFPSRSLSMPFH